MKQMNQNDLKEAYTSIAMTEQQNREVLSYVRSGPAVKSTLYRKLGLAFAVMMLFMIPGIRVRASQLLEKLQYTLFSDSGEQLPVMMENQEVTYHPSLPAKFDSLTDAETAFGIDLLDSSDRTCVRTGKLVHYYPMIVYDKQQHDHICGMSFQDFAYVTGDLKGFKVLPPGSDTTETEFRYKKGKSYGSPIALQIRMVTDADTAEAAGLVIGTEINVQEPHHYSENESTEIYHISGIDADAMIVSTRNVSMAGMGPALWEAPNPGIDHITTAYLSYEGIEYTYFGDVSEDTMKAFLETLR